jgi:protocatechuate 3,4-dioxygenase beta subunit
MKRTLCHPILWGLASLIGGVVSCWLILLAVSLPAAANAATMTPYQIAGVVRDYDGAPVQRVAISTAFGDPAHDFALTDANGAYTLTLPSGLYHLSARKYFNRLDPPEQTVTVTADQANVNFVFPARYTIQGVVRQADGTSVANVLVATNFDDPIYTHDQTSPSGAYSLTMLAGAYTIQVSKTGHVAPPAQTVSVPPSMADVDFTFVRPVQVSGVVRDEAGNPAAGATIYGGIDSIESADDGTYTLNVKPGEHSLWASKSGYAYSPSLLVPGLSDVTGVDFVLRRQNRTIYGRITNLQGEPLARARVGADTLLGFRLGSDFALTSPTGNYTLTVPAGVYWVEAGADGYVDTPPSEVDLTNATSIRVDLALEPTAFTIQGEVRDTAGQPLANASVFASGCDLFYSATTDVQGRYLLRAGVGEYRVRATKSGYQFADSQTVVLPPSAQHINFTLQLEPGSTPLPPPPPGPTYTVSGQVTDQNGQAVEAVTVKASGATYAYNGFTTTNQQGEYTVTIPIGSYSVVAEKDYYTRPPTQTVTVPPNHTKVDFVISSIARDYYVRGSVTDSEGKPVNDLEVVANLQAGLGKSEQKQLYYNGAYSISLAAGVYQVELDDFNYVTPPPSELTLPPDQDALNFTVRRIDQLVTGRVLDSHNNPICGARVEATGDATDRDFSTRNGRYRLRLPTGAYTLRASRSGFSDSPAQSVNLPPHALNTDFALTTVATPVPPGGGALKRFLPLIQR